MRTRRSVARAPKLSLERLEDRCLPNTGGFVPGFAEAAHAPFAVQRIESPQIEVHHDYGSDGWGAMPGWSRGLAALHNVESDRPAQVFAPHPLLNGFAPTAVSRPELGEATLAPSAPVRGPSVVLITADAPVAQVVFSIPRVDFVVQTPAVEAAVRHGPTLREVVTVLETKATVDAAATDPGRQAEAVRQATATTPFAAAADLAFRPGSAASPADTSQPTPRAIEAYLVTALSPAQWAAQRIVQDLNLPAGRGSADRPLADGNLPPRELPVVRLEGPGAARLGRIAAEPAPELQPASTNYVPASAGLLADVFAIDTAAVERGLQNLLAEVRGGGLVIAATPRRLRVADWLLAGLVMGTVAAALAQRHLRPAWNGAGSEEDSTWAWPVALRDLASGRQP